VLAGLEAGEHLLLVDEPGGGDDHGIHLVVGDEGEGVGHDAHTVELGGQGPGPRRVRSGHGDEPGT
jgi:hypothetical protein